MAIYERHTPENTLVYKVIARRWPGIKRDYAALDVSIASHVSSEFDRNAYLRANGSSSTTINKSISPPFNLPPS